MRFWLDKLRFQSKRSNDVEQQRGWRAALVEPRRFVIYLVGRLARDNCLRNASTLAYTTLLSIVPLLAVAFSILTAFPVFEPFNDRIQAFIFANLVPASGEVVQRYIERFTENAASLTAAGLVGLVVSAILMMSAVDRAINDIWHVHQHRSRLQGFMVYWSLLTTAPLLLGVSFGLSSYLGVLEELSPVALSGPRQVMLAITPYLAEVLAFLFLYAAVPNRRVPLAHAFMGALVGALLFELAKRGFGLYVSQVRTYEAVYGALSALPVFLLWIYVSWVVVLTGAEFTQALSGYRLGRAGSFGDPRWKLALTVRILGHLWRAQQTGRVLNGRMLMRHEPDAGEEAISECLRDLMRARVVVSANRGGYVLTRDPNRYTLLDLYRSQPFVLPQPGQIPAEGGRLSEVLYRAAEGAQRELDVSLAELLEEAQEAPKA